MSDKPKSGNATAFSDDKVWEWLTEMRVHMPDNVPLSDTSTARLDVISFRARAGLDSFALRVRTADGSEVDIVTNPPVARALIQAVTAAGQSAGWLDETGGLKCPPLPASE